MSVEPDFEGFRQAQVTLREKFGQDLRFYTPTPTVYPDGTQLDPESGEPYDPTVLPTASGFASAQVKVSVVSRPMGLSKRGIVAEAKRSIIGWLEEGGVVLIINTEDWPTIQDATRFVYADEEYTVRASDHDYLGPVDRYLMWGVQS